MSSHDREPSEGQQLTQAINRGMRSLEESIPVMASKGASEDELMQAGHQEADREPATGLLSSSDDAFLHNMLRGYALLLGYSRTPERLESLFNFARQEIQGDGSAYDEEAFDAAYFAGSKIATTLNLVMPPALPSECERAFRESLGELIADCVQVEMKLNRTGNIYLHRMLAGCVIHLSLQ